MTGCSLFGIELLSGGSIKWESLSTLKFVSVAQIYIYVIFRSKDNRSSRQPSTFFLK